MLLKVITQIAVPAVYFIPADWNLLTIAILSASVSLCNLGKICFLNPSYAK